MRIVRQSAVFGFSLALLAGVFIGLAWWGQDNWREVNAARKQLELRQRELRTLKQTTPKPSEATAVLMAADLARLNQDSAALRMALQAKGAAGRLLTDTPAPSNRTDAFFDLAAFVERSRARAQASGVAISADERFGFSEHAHGGPPTELIPVVFRQRMMVERLLEALIAARPQRLDAVQREAPVASPGDAGGGRGDYFTMPAARSLRAAGFVTAMAFRLSFTGQTSTLRSFLNSLATFTLPIVVRSVEAEPAMAERGPAGMEPGGLMLAGAGLDNAGVVPLVTPAPTKFTVTVEYLDLLEGSNPSA